MPRLRHPAALLAFGLLAAAPAAASIIDTATRYTVQVRTGTPVPFIQDHGQSWRGAGFLVDRGRGWILTNAHVAGYGPSRVRVAFQGEGFVDARTVYVDTHLDLAVLDVPGDAIPARARPASYDCARTPAAGEDVVAFGHPWDLDFTATRGIVSGVSTRWDTQWIQTDAPLNGGNSGGPLISLKTGEVVGISTASLGGRDTENLNFAVPMRQACPILELLRAGRDPTPAALPFTVAGREHGEDALVVARVPDEPGHPLRPGDRIVGIGDSAEAPTNPTELYRHLRARSGEIRVAYARDGDRATARVALQPVAPVLEREGVMIAGVLVAPVSRDLARAERGERLMVHWVKPGTPGKAAGFAAFDLIEAVAGEPVSDLEALRGVLDRHGGDDELRVIVRRLTNGSGWWSYEERLLPAAPVETIARERAD